MKLTFYGAAQTVTGSMFGLEVNGANILLDSGLPQGSHLTTVARNRRLPFEPARIQALILSHAHLDHSGNIPSVTAAGFTGNIYTTPATRDLCSAMLRDSARIQEQDAEYLNRKRSPGEPPAEPLYSVDEATQSLRCFVDLCYQRPFSVAGGVEGVFYDAGHILGSALTALDLAEGGGRLRLCYTGDLGSGHQPLLRQPSLVPAIDVLIVESTYGDRTHETPEDSRGKLQRIVNETWQRGGKVIVPAFAVGRTQALVYELDQLIRRRDIPDLPIYVDSPLAVNVTEIFRLHPECLEEGEAEFLASSREDPYGFGRLRYVRSVEESKGLNFLREPAIIISASGMAEAGRILHHLRNNISDPRNTILLVGYQAAGTLGRQIQERRPQVSIFREMVPVRAQVETIGGYSAHADRSGLLSWVNAVRGERLRRIYVVHGEEKPAQALAEALRELGGLEVSVPRLGEVVTLEAAAVPAS